MILSRVARDLGDSVCGSCGTEILGILGDRIARNVRERIAWNL